MATKTKKTSIWDDDAAQTAGAGSDHPDAAQADFSVPGTAYEGTVLEITDEIEGDYGVYRLVFLESDDGEVSFLAGSVLLDKIMRLRPKPGDTLGVKFKGMAKSKKQREYKDWEVRILRKDGDSLFND